MRFQFIENHRDEFPVRRMCNELNVSPSGYYAWRERPASAREMANQKLYNKIKAVYNDNMVSTVVRVSTTSSRTRVQPAAKTASPV